MSGPTKIYFYCLVVMMLLAPLGRCADGVQLKQPRFEPIKLHPDNGHYFLWRGKSTILITSAEHYGAVLNRNFDYKKYLPTLKSHGFNLTRTFSGAYCEPDKAFKIKNNTLSPAENALICPWARSTEIGYANGGNKFDLTKWDPEYFKRLKSFIRTAAKNGVVVELVLFCPFYEDAMWNLSPMNIINNVNGIGDMKRTEVYTLKHPQLLEIQKQMVRKIVRNFKGFDNLYYEICNEPYFGGVTLEWQKVIADTIVETETELGVRHLIAQNIANKSAKIENPNPKVSIFNFHYAKPPVAVSENYGLNKVIGDDETGFSGSEPKPYRIEAWDFIIAGGGIYNNLDYSFTVGAEDGTAQIDAPGGGGVGFRKQLEILKDFINSFDFIKMRPDRSVVKELPDNITEQVLSEAGRDYALYINGSGLKELTVEIPPGSYKSEWIDTKTANMLSENTLTHSGGRLKLPIPEYKDDIALRIKRSD
jgi:hypothetical protein